MSVYKFLLLFQVFYLHCQFIVTENSRLDSSGSHKRVKRIVGGEKTLSTEHPYFVYLDAADRMCGASIISKEYALTAAHCFVKSSGESYKSPVRIVGGIDKLSSGSDASFFADVSQVYIPKEFFNQKKRGILIADIAVLKLKQQLNISQNAFLELPGEKMYEGVEAEVTGFGWDKMKMNMKKSKVTWKGESSGHLRFVRTKVMNQQECRELYFNAGIQKSHICADIVPNSMLHAKGVCSGDGGGPLVHKEPRKKRTLLGILSDRRLGCNNFIMPAVFTRVSSYVDFIRKVQRNLKDPTIVSFSLPTLKESVPCCFKNGSTTMYQSE